MRIYKPITPSLRHVVLVNREFLYKSGALKKLTILIQHYAGRNTYGRKTIMHRGGGSKHLYRVVDYKRMYFGMPAEVVRLEYSPSRSSFIALVLYNNGLYTYILAPFQLVIGSTIYSSKKLLFTSIDIGCTGQISKIPIGTMLHNVELVSGLGAKLIRAAGTFALLLRKEDSNYCVIRLRSGERRLFPASIYATIGSVSNIEHRYTIFGKAGRSCWFDSRPVVRGVAMNPIDHPHGGNTPGGKVYSTPWAIPTKGKPTRKKPRSFIATY